MREVNVGILGAGGVGKTCIALRFTSGIYDPEYIPTISDMFESKFCINDSMYMLKIVDTAGQDEMDAISNIAIQNCEAFIIVYSITSQLSFNAIFKYREKINSFHPDLINRIILVANKCDMVDENKGLIEKGREVASEWSVDFIETSAKLDTNIRAIFESIINRVLNKKNRKKSQRDNEDGSEVDCKCSVA